MDAVLPQKLWIRYEIAFVMMGPKKNQDCQKLFFIPVGIKNGFYFLYYNVLVFFLSLLVPLAIDRRLQWNAAKIIVGTRVLACSSLGSFINVLRGPSMVFNHSPSVS